MAEVNQEVQTPENGNDKRFPFTFANRNGVLINGDHDNDSDEVIVYCKKVPNLRTIAEVRRFTKKRNQFVKVAERSLICFKRRTNVIRPRLDRWFKILTSRWILQV